MFTSPVPLGEISISMFESSPDAPTTTEPPDAAFVI